MRTNLMPGLHYATWLEWGPSDDEGAARNRACISLERLAEALPHGSGIDGDWYFTVARRPRRPGAAPVMVAGEYHVMDQWGRYAGWRTFRATIRRLPDGTLELGAVRGAGEHNDYLGELLAEAVERVTRKEPR